MYEDVLRFWMEEDNSGRMSEVGVPDSSPSEKVISALGKYGPGNSHLYPLVLRFFTSTPELLTAKKPVWNPCWNTSKAKRLCRHCLLCRFLVGTRWRALDLSRAG